MLTALRILNLVIWSALFVVMLPGARQAIGGKDWRRGDPWQLSVAAVCIVMVLGNLRWLLAADNDTLFALIYVLSSIVGLYKLLLARTYGRGPKL
jgi:hypothetical protein